MEAAGSRTFQHCVSGVLCGLEKNLLDSSQALLWLCIASICSCTRDVHVVYVFAAILALS